MRKKHKIQKNRKQKQAMRKTARQETKTVCGAQMGTPSMG